MKNELTILTTLRSFIAANINTYLPSGAAAVAGKSVVLNVYPAVESMTSNETIFIVPDYAEYENFATTNDASFFHVSVVIFCKRDTIANLQTRVYDLYNALFELLRSTQGLGGAVDFVDISTAIFDMAVEMNRSVQGIEVPLTIRYTKDY